MKKEETLDKIDESSLGEGKEYAEDQGHALRNVVLSALSVLLLTFSFILKSDAFYAVAGLSFAYSAVQYYEKYQFAKKKTWLLLFILDTILSISGIVIFTVTLLKK